MHLPFKPDATGTVNINVSNASQSVQVYGERGPLSIRIMNDGTATVWISFGGSGVAASTSTGIPIAAGSVEVLTLGNDNGNGPLYVAAIAAASSGYIYFTPGRGL